MFFYYGKTFESSRAGGAVVGVVCDECGCKYYYELARIGSGAKTASYGIGTSRASQKANEQSEIDLQRRLATEAELVPCPKCNWINDELVKGYRLGRYLALGKVALAVGLAGSILSLVAAWFIHLGTPRDRWLLPYLLLGGPAVFASMAIALLLFRGWLRSRIQPNRAFPQEPHLPPGSPPALALEESTQTLRLAKPVATPVDDILNFQLGRHTLPALCCACLQPSATDHGYSIVVTELLHLRIPMCAPCAERMQREYQRNSAIILVLGLLVGGAMVGAMVLASMQWWVILVWFLVLFGVVLALAAFIAWVRTAPVKVTGTDPSRGVVRLRFRNPAYVQHVAPMIEPGVEAN